LKVLVACEFSGIVRDAFIRQGFDALSCDLLSTESEMGPHVTSDVLEIIHEDDWDCMLAFPPCTYLCNSGVRWLYKDGKQLNGRDEKRWHEMKQAAKFFNALLNAPIPHIAIENPVQHSHAGLPDFTQSIQPWQFGHGEVKRTCLWLKNLPLLVPTNVVDGRTPRVHHEPPSADRWKKRSITYPGIAEAMATQWGSYLKEKENGSVFRLV
jgi:hypothetical protein